MVMPYDGRLVKALVRGTAAPANVSLLRLYAATDGTERPTQMGTPQATNEQVGVDISAAANTTYTFSTTGSQHFSAGECVAISFQPGHSAGIGECQITFVWEFDMRGEAH